MAMTKQKVKFYILSLDDISNYLNGLICTSIRVVVPVIMDALKYARTRLGAPSVMSTGRMKTQV